MDLLIFFGLIYLYFYYLHKFLVKIKPNLATSKLFSTLFVVILIFSVSILLILSVIMITLSFYLANYFIIFVFCFAFSLSFNYHLVSSGSN